MDALGICFTNGFRPKNAMPGYVVQRKGQTAQTMEYNVRIPYLPWMEQSELKLITDLCGCGWEVLQQSTKPVAQMDFREPEEPQLLVEYIAPKHEAVKTRQLAGSAFLDFPVNRTEIHPQYRNNPRELAKIQATIDSVRNNRFATITAVDIKGYASPEGSYSNNARAWRRDVPQPCAIMCVGCMILATPNSPCHPNPKIGKDYAA